MARILELPCLPQGNFLFIQTEKEAGAVVDYLLQKGIIVRDCRSFPGCGKDRLRVTVGRPEENNRFLEEFEKAR